MRFFNTAGPVVASDHYCLDPLKRLDLDELLLLIAQKKYFVLHAPRQTGKTSTLLALLHYLNRAGTDSGHLVIFDRRKHISWEEKVFRQERVLDGKRITVWGM